MMTRKSFYLYTVFFVFLFLGSIFFAKNIFADTYCNSLPGYICSHANLFASYSFDDNNNPQVLTLSGYYGGGFNVYNTCYPDEGSFVYTLGEFTYDILSTGLNGNLASVVVPRANGYPGSCGDFAEWIYDYSKNINISSLPAGPYTARVSSTNSQNEVVTYDVYFTVSRSSSMTGTVTASDCSITAGNSSCSSSIAWSDTTAPVATSAVTTPTNITVGTGNTAGSTTYTVDRGDRTFYLYNDGVLLNQDTATASCTSGTDWNGSACVVNGSCSSTHYNCALGTSINNVDGSTAWTWTCSSGGSNASCSETKPVSTACGGGVDIGLRIYDGGVKKVAVEAGAATSVLRIYKNGVRGIVLVATNDANASKMRVQTSGGIKAYCIIP